jgi:pimeloyl-ACP methyl ester carboxylesterase
MIDVAILPPKGSHLGFGSGLREAGSFWGSVLKPPPFPADAPKGDGHTVLVIPGFLAADWTTARMRSFLRGLGYRTKTARITFNAGPTPRMLARLDETLLALSNDAPISIVGQSLGGVLARSLAARHKGGVRSVITLGSPIRFPVTTPLKPFASMLTPFQDKAWLGDLGQIGRAPGVPVTAVYSEDDGILDWRQCLQDEDALCRNVRITGAHATMGSNPEAQLAMALALSASRG